MLRPTRLEAGGFPSCEVSSLVRWPSGWGAARTAVVCAAGLLALAAGCAARGGLPVLGARAGIGEGSGWSGPVQHAIEVQVLTVEVDQPGAR